MCQVYRRESMHVLRITMLKALRSPFEHVFSGFQRLLVLGWLALVSFYAPIKKHTYFCWHVYICTVH